MSSSQAPGLDTSFSGPRWQDLSWERISSDLLSALRFLTWLPLPGKQTDDGPANALAFFPLIGFMLGVVLALLDGLLGFAGLPIMARSALDIVMLIVLTRAIHLDGLMDSCDGLFGGHDSEQRLQIMRDSRVGSFAVVGCASILLLKLGFLDSVTSLERSASLILAPVLGRWSIVIAAALFPPARPDGMGAAFSTGATIPRVVVATFFTILVTVWAAGSTGLVAMAVVWAMVWIVGAAITRLIPGLSGDSFGMIAEVAEVLTLFCLVLAR